MYTNTPILSPFRASGGIRKGLVESGHSAVLGGKVSLKLDTVCRIGPLVDSFLTAATCAFTLPLRLSRRSRGRPVESFVEGTQRGVPTIDVGAIRVLGNRFNIRPVVHGRLMDRNPPALGIRRLFHAGRRGFGLTDHHRRHTTAGLANLFASSLNQPVMADLVGADAGYAAMVAMDWVGVQTGRHFAKAVAEPVDAR